MTYGTQILTSWGPQTTKEILCPCPGRPVPTVIYDFFPYSGQFIVPEVGLVLVMPVVVVVVVLVVVGAEVVVVVIVLVVVIVVAAVVVVVVLVVILVAVVVVVVVASDVVVVVVLITHFIHMATSNMRNKR